MLYDAQISKAETRSLVEPEASGVECVKCGSRATYSRYDYLEGNHLRIMRCNYCDQWVCEDCIEKGHKC